MTDQEMLNVMELTYFIEKLYNNNTSAVKSLIVDDCIPSKIMKFNDTNEYFNIVYYKNIINFTNINKDATEITREELLLNEEIRLEYESTLPKKNAKVKKK